MYGSLFGRLQEINNCKKIGNLQSYIIARKSPYAGMNKAHQCPAFWGWRRKTAVRLQMEKSKVLNKKKNVIECKTSFNYCISGMEHVGKLQQGHSGQF